ncbi:MAG: M23 family metallopeptidase [Elainellaceae cyanobacterium]
MQAWRRLMRWVVLMGVATLMSCIFHPALIPAGQFEQRAADVEVPVEVPIDGAAASHTWLLQFPQYWSAQGRCEVRGTGSTLLVQEGDRLEGTMPWIWDGAHTVARLSGEMKNNRMSLNLEPPNQQGFGITYQGRKVGNLFSGRAKADGVCSRQAGEFRLTQLPSPQKPEGMPAVALLQKPFEHEFLMTNYFDHDTPRQFVDANGYVVNWQGDRLSVGSPGAGIDGHAGYDWGTPEGTPLLAVADGIVRFAGEGDAFFCPPLNQMTTGLYVYLEHEAETGDRYETEYIHLSRVDVRSGDRVTAGQVIGLSGNTGCSTGPHLHFGVRRFVGRSNKVLVDPYGWSRKKTDPWSRNAEGVESVWLWKPGQAPMLHEYGR